MVHILYSVHIILLLYLIMYNPFGFLCCSCGSDSDTLKNLKVISDESNYLLFPSPCHLMIRWRLGEAYKPWCLTPIVTFGGESVMIWRCFSKAGFLFGKTHISSHV